MKSLYQKLCLAVSSACFITACDNGIEFQEITRTCEPPRSSARFGTNPGPVITSPDVNHPSNGPITLQGTCVSGIDVRVTGPGISEFETVSCENGSFSADVVFSTGDGTKDFTVTQASLGGQDISDRRCFTQDTVPPKVDITGSSGALSTNQTTVQVNGICEAGIDVEISGATLVGGPVTTACNGGAFAATITFTGVDGLKEIVATQVDPAGNSGNDDQSYITDTTPPNIQITGPAPMTLAQSGVTVIGTCEDNAGPVLLTGPGLQSGFATVGCVSGTFSQTIQFSIGDGLKNIVASQTDLAGNEATDNRDFLKDNTAPNLSITSPAANSLTQGTINLQGACETGLIVNIAGAGVAIPRTATCIAGTYGRSITLTSGDGSKLVEVSQTDQAGNSSSANRSFIRDNTAPLISITSPAANSIVTTTTTLTGNCENGLAVNLSGAGLQGPSTANCSGGSYSVNITFTNGDGTKNIVASQTDGAGNTGSDNRNFVRDTNAPSILITSPAANSFAGNTLSLAGSCESGLPVQISGGGVQANSTATCSGGSFNTLITLSAGEGTKNVIASQTDAAGNSASDNRDFIKDTVAPAVTINAPAAGTVAVSGLTLTGTCEDSLAVNLSGSGLLSPSTTTCNSGAYNVDINFTGGDGSKEISVSQTDAAGNTGSDNRAFERDSSLPNLQITAPAANTVAQNGVNLQGVCEDGLPVTLGGAGLASPSSTNCSSGQFNVAILFTNGDGTKNITAEQVDAAGNTATDNRNFIKDTTAPNITITAPLAGTVAQNGVNLEGTCETGLTVNLSGAGLGGPASTTCNAGNFNVNITFSSGDGNKNIVATQTDAAGNSASDNRDFIRDNNGPAVAILSPNENTVAQNGVTLQGSCESGLEVTISGSGASTSQTVNCSAGAFSANVNFSNGDGTKNLVATQTDAAGNIGSDNRNFIRDTNGPNIQITGPAALTTTQNTIDLVGICEDGLPVSLSGSGLNSPSSTNCNSGSFNVQITLTPGDGNKTVVATQTDSVGNSANDSRDFVLDTTAPVIAISSPAANSLVNDGVIVSGSCENGLVVNLSGAGHASPSTANCSSGSFSVNMNFSSGDGIKNIVASQTDAAGNTGSDNRNFEVDNTAPVVSITSPAAGTVATDGLTLQGSCENGLTVNLSGTGLSSPSTTTCSSGQFSAAILFTGGDGSKNIIASQTDAAGNTGSDNRSFVRDSLGPNIAITAPAALTEVNSSLVLQGICETGLTVNLSGAGLASPSSTSCSASSFSVSIQLTSGQGIKNIVAAQTDAAGNTSSDNRDFVRDSIAPVVAITGPAVNTLAVNGVTLTGTCENGLPVNLSGSGHASPSTATCSTGTFSIAVLFSNGDGTKNIIASQTDAAGNTGSDNRDFIRDGSAPNIQITSPIAGTQIGESFTLAGTCESGLTISLGGAGHLSPSTTTCIGSSFSTSVTVTSGGGIKTISASQTDAAGNTGSDSRDFVRDTTAPIVQITSPAQNTSAQTGLTVAGTCETGLDVTLAGTGASAPVVTSCISGAFSSNVNFSSGDGTKNITATQTDNFGNSASDNRDFIRDTSAPVLVITGPAANTLASSGVTLTGTCEAGLTVNLSGSGHSSPSSTNCASGTFSVAILFSSGDGTKNIVASQTDAAGNSASDNRNFIRDTTAPSIQITSPLPGTIIGGNVVIQGTCESGLLVTLSGSGHVSPSGTSCIGGAFSADVTVTDGDGSKLITASQTDSLANVGSDSRSFTRDQTPPVVAITSPAAGTSAQTGLTISGICESGITVVLFGPGVGVPQVDTPCSGGSFSASVPFSAGEGTKTITAGQTDDVGNFATDSRDYIRDNTAPSITITGPAAGTIASSGVTLTGTCEAGLTVNLSGAGHSAPSSTSCAAGTFSVAITFSSGDGSKNIIASQTDDAGNSASDNRDFIRDNTAPVVTITGPAAGTINSTGVTLVGTCEDGLPVDLSGAGLGSPSVTTCSSGSFSVAIIFSAGDGSKNIVASQTDGLGNTGSDNRSFVRDSTAPAIAITGPAANTSAQNGVTLVGTCEDGLVVNLSGAGHSSPASTNCSGGSFSASVNFSPGDGVKNIIVTQTDQAGNTDSDNRDFIRDTIAPNIVITSPAAGSDQNGSITLSGSCETGLTVSLSGDISANTNTTCDAGNFSLLLNFSAGVGTKNVVASQTDAAGNTGSDNRDFNNTNNSGFESFTSQGPGGLVDILFIDDNSASMETEQAALGLRFPSLAAQLDEVDWQAGITTTDCDPTSPFFLCGTLLEMVGTTSYILNNLVPNFETIFQNTIERPETPGCTFTPAGCPSGDEVPLLSGMTAMDKRDTDNAGFFRAGADLAVVVLSDEDEGGSPIPSDTTPQEFVDHFKSIWPNQKKLSVYGIIIQPGDNSCLTQQQSQFGGQAQFGTYVDELAGLTNGATFSVCDADYTVTLETIGDNVTQLSRSIDLQETPIPGTVSVSFNPAFTTHFSVSGNRVTFDVMPPLGTQIDISYEY